MTVTLDVPPAVAEQIAHDPAARERAERMIEAAFATTAVPVADAPLKARPVPLPIPRGTPESYPQTPEEIAAWIKRFQEFIDSHDPNIPPLSDYAMSRDSIYEDC